MVENAIRQCNLSPIAFGDWDVLMGQPTEVLADLLELRAQHLATKDRAEDAEQAVTALRGLGSATAGQLFNAAGVLNNCLKRTELLDDTPESKVENLGKDGIATLREAIEAGFDDVLRLKNDPYIDRLRDRPEFQSLVDLLGQR